MRLLQRCICVGQGAPMARMTKLFPPYTGNQPFIFLCFSDSDAKRLRPLLERLYERGCRIWYPVGHVGTAAEREQRDARMKEAHLVILYQTKHARADHAAKSAVLVCQERSIPIISIDTDDAESALSMGLDPRAVHLKARGVDAQEDALLRTDGFSQELIGPPMTVRKRPLFAIAAVILAAALLLTGAALLCRRLHPPASVQPNDTVFFSDPALTQAVRDVLLDEPITEDSLKAITALRLPSLPESTDELALLPNLSRIELDQKNAGDAAPLLGRYEIVLTGGNP